MNQVIDVYGGLSRISEFSSLYEDKNILLVTGKQSYFASGANDTVSCILKNQNVIRFFDFDVNPKIEDAIKGREIASNNNIECIIAIGGGSVIDIAKLIKAFLSCDGEPISIVKGIVEVEDPGIPIIAVPTTAGSGSEATHFAVVYVDSEKYSVASQYLQPDVTILDGQLTVSGDRYLKACNCLDALAQAIESAWAVGANDKSRSIAFEALHLGLNSMIEFIQDTNNATICQSMIRAANLSGQAINVSKTTAAHAWSYGITSQTGIPHGHAIWFTLPKIFEIHFHRSQKSDNLEFRNIMEKLALTLGVNSTKPIEQQLTDLLKSIEVNIQFNYNGMEKMSLRETLSQQINMQRMNNNPVKFTDSEINEIFEII